MAIYASFHTRGTQRVDVVSLGAISASQPTLATNQLFVACAQRPKAGPVMPTAVQPLPPPRR